MMSGADLWIITPEAQRKYDEQFFQLSPLSGLLSGEQAKTLFLQSGLPAPVLAHIWALADMNSDGKINQHEFAVALHLIQMKLRGYEIPKTLPPTLRVPKPAFPSPAGIIGGVSPSSQMMSNGSMLMGQNILSGSPFVKPPTSSLDMQHPRSGSVSSSQGSPTASAASPLAMLTEWAVPQPSKLKYAQLFNSHDRNRSGFLTGVQARSILLQSGLPQNTLAQIWTLSDLDSDGKLGCEEFILAMHLIDCVRMGDSLPSVLPADLLPPSFRHRSRSASVASTGSASQGMLGDLANLDFKDDEKARQLQLATFEDKRRENFEKGQAELERRRLALLESQRKEQEERRRKEKEEYEKREQIRLEQERRRQLELEKQLAKQRELEIEKEEQRRKLLEQREAARREMERQRQLEWERQRLQELATQRQREQETVCHLKNRNKSLAFELERLSGETGELSEKIGLTRKEVTELKTSIDEMRTTRDKKLSELNGIRQQVNEISNKLLVISQEKASLLANRQPSSALVDKHFGGRRLSLNQLQTMLTQVEQDTKRKQENLDGNNRQLSGLKEELAQLTLSHDKLSEEYERKRQLVLNMTKQKKSNGVIHVNNVDDAFGDQKSSQWDAFGMSSTNAFPPAAASGDSGRFIKYRALYAFESRNSDELSIMPGDVIMVPEMQSSEPGWLGGELRGKMGWFPEAYAERVESPTEGQVAPATAPPPVVAAETVHIVGTEMKRTLEGISEAPENGSDVGFEEQPHVSSVAQSVESAFTSAATDVSPVPGQGDMAPDGLQAQALFPWKAKKDNHLSFNKGDIITIREQQDLWWFGQLDEQSGWLPKSYVRLLSEAYEGGGTPQESPLPPLEEEEPVDVQQQLPAKVESPLRDEEIVTCYVAMYSYNSQEACDLSFQQGDLIQVDKKDGDWWTGRLKGAVQSGTFPSNYVRLAEPSELVPQPTSSESCKLEEESMNSFAETTFNNEFDRSDNGSVDSPKPKNTKTLKKPEIVTVIAPYKATGAEQLTLEKGQLLQVRKKSPSGWWEGEMQAKGKKRQIGWFPATYVKQLGGSSASSNRSTPDPITQQLKQAEDLGDSPPADQVVALYPFSSQQEDELTFQKGQVITVLSREDTAWWKGDMGGRIGLFPANYVEPLQQKNSTTTTPTAGQWVGDWQVFQSLSLMEKRRQGHIHELIDTEESYMADMSIVLDVFHRPLRESGLMTDEELRMIFVNWKELIVCNNKLHKSLRVRKKMSHDGIIQMIGDILCENLPHFTPYIRFCSCQLRAASLIQKKTENTPGFKELARRCCRDPRTKGMPLSSFLIKPMQRITKYPLMIKKIIEFTPRDHPDTGNMEESLSLAEQLCSQVNEGVRELENTERLEWIQNHVHCDALPEGLTFNSPTNCLGPRKLLHSGTLFKTKSNKELVGFLFNDFLLLSQPLKEIGKVTNVFTSEKARSAHYRMYRQPIFLNSIMLRSSPESPDDLIFTICLLETTYILKAVNSNERLLWVKKLQESSKNYIETEKSNFTRQHSKASSKLVGVGRLLVHVMEGFKLKACSANVRRRPVLGILKIVVVEACELANPDGKGRSDPYCEVNMGSQEHRTKVVPNTTEPKWNASMQFLVKDLRQDVLCISVYDRDLFSPNNFLGRTEVQVADIYKETGQVKGPIVKRLLLYEVETGEVELKLDLQLFHS